MGTGSEPGDPAGEPPDNSPDGLTTIEIDNNPKRALSRLTRAQFLSSVGVLLGSEASRADALVGVAELVPDPIPNGGYGNSGFAQSQAYDVVLGFDSAARQVVKNITDFGAVHTRYGGCTEYACVDTFITQFLTAALRRPPTADESAALKPIVEAAQADGLSYDSAVGYLIRAILQSPEFLYLFEDEALTPYQLATRLSFFLTDAPPDAELTLAAADGSLATADVLTAHIDRLLEAKGEAFARAFAYDFLGLRRAYQRSVEIDPVVLDQLVASATDSFARFVRDDVEVGALFTTDEFVANAETAKFMSLEANADSLLQTGAAYPFHGLLTHPAVLIAMSNAVEGSTVSRGQFIAHQLLCVPPTPAPSADLIAQELKDDLLPADPTQRDEAEARLRAPSCQGCHLQFEPYAFGLNKWGGDGSFKDDARLKDNGPITTTLGSFEFDGYADYLPLLANSEQYQRCISDHLLRYALRHTDYSAEVRTAVVTSATDAGAGAPLSFRNLVKAIALQPAFAKR